MKWRRKHKSIVCHQFLQQLEDMYTFEPFRDLRAVMMP